MSSGIIVGGSARLSREFEAALNLLLLRHGGSHHGAQLYKLEWAADTNRGKVVPVCFGEQGSYHLLSWEPPSPVLSAFSRALNEDTSRGTYSCITHFVDRDGNPFQPTSFIVESIIPILNRAKDTALAALHGERAIVERNRAKRKEQLLAEEKAKERAYDSFAESVLNDAKPAFSGNPMSGSTISANKTLSDIKKSPSAEQPESFDFTIRSSQPVADKKL